MCMNIYLNIVMHMFYEHTPTHNYMSACVCVRER